MSEASRFDSRTKEVGERLIRVDALGSTNRVVLRLQVIHRPVKNGIGGVVEHLADDFAPDSRIAAPLHLDKGWDGILVEEKVIEKTPPANASIQRYAGFTSDQ